VYFYDKVTGKVKHSKAFINTSNVYKFNWNDVRNKIINIPDLMRDCNISEFRVTQFSALVCLLAVTGCRISEGLLIKFNDFQYDKERLVLIVTLQNLKRNPNSKNVIKRYPISFDKLKNKDYQLTIPIINYLAKVKKAIRNRKFKETDLLFGNLTREIVYYYCTKYLNINPHGFRHLRLQNLIVDEQKNVKVVQKIAGHTNINHLDSYIELSTKNIEDELYG